MTKTATKAAQPTKVVTSKVRFSYLHVFHPHAIEEGQDPKYSVCLLIPKSEKALVAKIEKAIEAAKKASVAKLGGKIPANLKTPLRDGDVDRDTEEQPEYANCWFLNANCKTKPGVIDKDGNGILDEGELYSGCYGRASVNFYAFNTSGNKGIACGLNNLQKLADGESLGGRASAESDFDDDFEYEDDDDLLG